MRSSLAKAHVNKSRRFSGKNQSANAISRVLGTVRTAAAAVAAEERMIETEMEQYDGISNVAANVSRTSKPLTNNLKSVIESTVADMLKFCIRQDTHGDMFPSWMRKAGQSLLAMQC